MLGISGKVTVARAGTDYYALIELDSEIFKSYDEVCKAAGLDYRLFQTGTALPKYKFTFGSSDLDHGLSWRAQGVHDESQIVIEDRS